MGVPLDHGAITVLYLSGMVSFEEYQQVNAPGLDRMVTKKIGKSSVRCCINLVLTFSLRYTV